MCVAATQDAEGWICDMPDGEEIESLAFGRRYIAVCLLTRTERGGPYLCALLFATWAGRDQPAQSSDFHDRWYASYDHRN